MYSTVEDIVYSFVLVRASAVAGANLHHEPPDFDPVAIQSVEGGWSGRGESRGHGGHDLIEAELPA
jgi:hypothetical protein